MVLEVLSLGHRQRQLKAPPRHGPKVRQVSLNQVAVKMVRDLNRTRIIFNLLLNSLELSGSSSPLNHSSMSDKHKPTVEIALNSLTSEMVRVCYTEAKSIRIYNSQD